MSAVVCRRSAPGVVCALGWEDYPGVAGGLFILVGADGDYFRDGTEPFITIFLGFWAICLWPHMQKRVNNMFTVSLLSACKKA